MIKRLILLSCALAACNPLTGDQASLVNSAFHPGSGSTSAPVISSISNQSSYYNISVAIPFTISDSSGNVSCLTDVVVTSSNSAIFNPSTDGVLSGSSPNCVLTITPAASQSGSAQVTVTVRGVSSTASSVFTFSTSWAPESLGSSLKLWLDADDSTSFTFGAGTAVAQWRDKSGTANHVSQAVALNQPLRVAAAINSRAVVRFDGTNSFIERAAFVAALPNPYTMAVAYQVNTYKNFNVIYSHSTSNVQGYHTDAIKSYLYSGGLLFVANVLAGLHQTVITWNNPGNSDFTLDGSAVSSGACGAVGQLPGIRIGGEGAGGNPSAVLDGDVAELLAINGSLTAADRQRVEGYLAHRWGNTADLPAGHPYKSVAP